VTVGFVCAAAFVVVRQRYGLVNACLARAGVFLVATIALLGTYAIYLGRRRRNAQARAALESPPISALADPPAGLQIVQAIGFKRLLPILAIGGAALDQPIFRDLFRAGNLQTIRPNGMHPQPSALSSKI
jgi:hypothetical protein